jgi:hypothetical protein
VCNLCEQKMEVSDLLIQIKVYNTVHFLVFDAKIPSVSALACVLSFYSPVTEYQVEIIWPNGRSLTTPLSTPNCWNTTVDQFKLV